MKTKFLILIFTLASLACAQQTMPLGFFGQVPVRTGNVAADTITLVPGQMSTLLTATPTAAAALTTPTATLLCRLFPFVGAQGSNNFWWPWIVKNTSAGANTITITAGSGVTVVGTATIVQSSAKMFLITLTSCGTTPAAQVISVGTFVF